MSKIPIGGPVNGVVGHSLADIAHHTLRIEWANSNTPTFFCGDKLPPWMIDNIRNQSVSALSFLRKHGMSDNTCHCDPPCCPPNQEITGAIPAKDIK